MNKENVKKIWDAVKRIVEIVIAIICGTSLSGFVNF